jgi:hypothetical protein
VAVVVLCNISLCLRAARRIDCEIEGGWYQDEGQLGNCNFLTLVGLVTIK